MRITNPHLHTTLVVGYWRGESCRPHRIASEVALKYTPLLRQNPNSRRLLLVFSKRYGISYHGYLENTERHEASSITPVRPNRVPLFFWFSIRQTSYNILRQYVGCDYQIGSHLVVVLNRWGKISLSPFPPLLGLCTAYSHLLCDYRYVTVYQLPLYYFLKPLLSITVLYNLIMTSATKTKT